MLRKPGMSLHGTSRRFSALAEFGRYRGIADMAGLAAGSTRLRMTQSRHTLADRGAACHGKASESWTGVRVSALAGAAITALKKRSAPRPQRRSPERLRRRRCERFSLLHNVRDQNDALDVGRLTTCMGCLGRYLEGIAFFDRTGGLTLYGKFEGAFDNVSGFRSPDACVAQRWFLVLLSPRQVASHTPGPDHPSATRSFA